MYFSFNVQQNKGIYKYEDNCTLCQTPHTNIEIFEARKKGAIFVAFTQSNRSIKARNCKIYHIAADEEKGQ